MEHRAVADPVALEEVESKFGTFAVQVDGRCEGESWFGRKGSGLRIRRARVQQRRHAHPGAV